jgi:hypothetical protein
MSDARDVGNTLAEAERAASLGDLATAEAALRDAARLQEAELGPLHLDLASTLNNLGVVTEKTGRPDDAEAFYRRAFAIASASLPPDDPTIAEIRQNLEDFCRARGVPIERPAIAEPAVIEPAVIEPPAVEPPAIEVPPVERAVAEADVVEPAPRAAAVAVQNDSRTPATIAIGVIAVIALMVIAFVILRPRSSPEIAPRTPAGEPAPARAAEPPRRSVTPAPVDQPTPRAATKPAPALPPADITLATAQLCRNFSTADGNWRCDPAGDSVPPGPLVLYTRVRSARDGVVVHRWFRGDLLRKTAQLRIVANPAEGFRTYSRQTVDAGEWRVEVRSVAGDLLHEQRIAVR